jgi:hypothetical protein
MRSRRVTIVALVALALVLWAGPSPAEIIAQRTISQNITTGGSDCSTATTCVILPDVFRTVGVGVQLAGTWVGTAQFEGTLDGTNWASLLLTPLGTTTAVTSATANGIWTAPSQVLIGVRVRASVFTSGPITVSIAGR